ncbi:MAG: hypothetical protein JWM11_3613 [Planctomycetaceae bacterium]|nr:hypothetical protein [Planctomycetaceae bacterium]
MPCDSICSEKQHVSPNWDILNRYDAQWHPADPNMRETADSVRDKLFRLILCMIIASLPVAFGSLTLPNPQYVWTDGLLAAVLGGIAMARFAWREELPVFLGAISGMISGAGSYLATMVLLLEIKVVSKSLVFLFPFVGSLPGLMLFYVLVWIYYTWFDSDDHGSNESLAQFRE